MRRCGGLLNPIPSHKCLFCEIQPSSCVPKRLIGLKYFALPDLTSSTGANM